MALAFDNSYARLPEKFYTRQDPVAVPAPDLAVLNTGLAADLGLDTTELTADILAGNTVPEGAAPLAQAYSGHQFGHWSGQLGDGRAILLGEVITPDKQRFDMVLKGAGRTPYSRGGDGRAWLGPVLREYLVSEAMFSLGVPTTRALAVVTTGEEILREDTYPGAILTRIAASHIRVGTFQHFAAANDLEALEILVQHVITRHYPDAKGALGLLEGVIKAQANLVTKWMGFGFIHGVMNTDNMTISGETIDYGPCAFMDGFDPEQVFSSIDQMGRYAWDQQPDMAAWNLTQLASCLLPLIDNESEAALVKARAALEQFSVIYEAEWLKVFRAKLGLVRAEDGDASLINGLLTRMAASGADFTATFRALGNGTAGTHITNPGAWDSWAQGWHARLGRETGDTVAVMNAANPAIIARNYLVEDAISAALTGDMAPFFRLNTALEKPFDDVAEFADLRVIPEPSTKIYQTFCGT